MNLKVTDFKIPEELERYRNAVREFVLTELEPIAEKIEETNYIPDDLWPKLRESGLLRMTLPKEFGGFGITFSQWYPILEEVAKTHGTIRLIVHAWNWLFWTQLVRYGTPEQQKILEPFSRGEYRIAWAVTEPGTGSGADIKTTGVKDGGDWIINGRKHLISFGECANGYIIFCRTNPDRYGGLSSFLIEKGTPGFRTIAQPEPMGMRGRPDGLLGILEFDDCRVNENKSMIGKAGSGRDQMLEALDASRASIGVSCLGLSQRFLELSVNYAKKRVTFGRPIIERQAVQQLLAEMATRIYALRMMSRDVARKLDAKEWCRKEAGMFKLFGIDTVRTVSDMAFEIHGGIGYLKATPIERMYRDARGPWFEEGTPSIQRFEISRQLLKEAG